MPLSSLVFITIFLPLSIFIYYLLPKTLLKNIFLVILSLFFYAWGEPKYILLLIITIVINYIFGLLIGKFKEYKAGKFIVFLMILWNFGALYYFKYLIFTINNINSIFDMSLSLPNIALPLGISFITFRCVSYCLDIFFQAVNSSKNIINVALYISFFPQILIGPITKYNQFEPQISNRVFNLELFYNGIQRFIIGLAKKVIIADTIGIVVNYIFDLPAGDRTVALAWIGSIGYLLQLYFDFSGYSDMAIGVGQMFGFKTPENFNYPYMSKSAVEFWNRWHMTLGVWVKDYMFTPIYRSLAGRQNIFTKKTFSVTACDSIALFCVWLFIGLWHGAGWLFILYGLFWFTFIFIERRFDNYKTKKRKRLKIKKKNISLKEKILAHIYFVIILVFAQTLFRSPTIEFWISYCKDMLGLSNAVLYNGVDLFFIKDNIILFIISIFGIFPIIPAIRNQINSKPVINKIVNILVAIGLLGLFIICLSYLVNGSYNPFLYFNF